MAEPPLKILIALQYYLPHRTGLTLHVQRIAEALVARGHQVTVLTARFDPRTPRDEEVIAGVRVVRLWAPLRISRGMVMPAYPWAAWALVGQHDVVSIHTPMLETPVFAWYTKLRKRGLVITHHGDLTLPKGFFNRLIERVTFGLHAIAGNAAQRFIAYSKDYADHSRFIGPWRAKTKVVYPPIVIPEPDPNRVEELRAEWLAEGGTHLVVYSGRFVEEKRADVLIRSLETIHRRFPGARIVFAGQYRIPYEGFYERNLELVERFREHLIFLGLIESAEELASIYAACDVLALPSDTECMALVQAEAMLCGTPVVATDIPGAREVVRVTGMGEIVPRREPEKLGEALVRVLEDPGRYFKPREEIDRAFNLDETVRRYEKHLRDAASEARPS